MNDSCAVVEEPSQEFRAAWVTAWSGGFLSPEEADETTRLAKEANLNALIIQVRKIGDAYYDSSLEPRGSNILGGNQYDPLAYVVEKAHAQGLEVHAWINAFRVWRGEQPPDDPRHVAKMHPEWLTKTKAGKVVSADGWFLDPGVPEVKEHLAKIAAEIVSKYPVDGIHLDYIRYPGIDFGYNEISIARFNTITGKNEKPRNNNPEWTQWRRDQVTEAVRKVRHAIKAARPGVKLTVAGIAWGDCPQDFRKSSPYSKVYQDWRGWLREGIIDACIPMNYKDDRNPEHAKAYRNWLECMASWRYDRQIYNGIMVSEDAESAVQQVKAAREYSADGVSLFAFNVSTWREKLVKALRAEVFQDTAKTPVMAWKQPSETPASSTGPEL